MKKYSIRYNIVVLVETILAISIHILVNKYGLKPETYSEVIEALCEKLDIKCRSDLVALVKMRNLLIHRYWKIDDELMYRSVKRDFRCAEEFINKVLELIGD